MILMSFSFGLSEFHWGVSAGRGYWLKATGSSLKRLWVPSHPFFSSSTFSSEALKYRTMLVPSVHSATWNEVSGHAGGTCRPASSASVENRDTSSTTFLLCPRWNIKIEVMEHDGLTDPGRTFNKTLSRKCFILNLWCNKIKAIKVWQLALKMLLYAFRMYF